MKKILIIGAHPIGYELAAAMHELIAEPIEIQQKQQSKAFEPEPFLIKNTFIEPPTYYEHQPSKFINKPKNNYKRR